MKTPLLLAVLLLFMCRISPVIAQKSLPFVPVSSAAAEICDNQVDDDGDGYVDCYDADCTCATDPPCSIPSVPSKFKAQTAWQTPVESSSTAASPIVANMNPQTDQMPEIIVPTAVSLPNNPVLPGYSNKIQFFRGDGSNAANPMILTIPGTVFYNRPLSGPTVGDIDGDGKPELLITCNDRRIRVYNNYTENPVAPMTLWIVSADLVDIAPQRPLLADFDGDGISEVYVGSDVFKFNLTNPAAPTLTRVLNGFSYMGKSFWLNGGSGGCNPTAADLLSVADCNGDPDCAGLELAAGAMIYSIDLDPNDGDGYEIKNQRYLGQLTPGSSYADGYTAVADVDLDGTLDVIVSSAVNGFTGVYAWNKNGLIKFFPYPTNTTLSGALACVANVYDDKVQGFAQDFPEILVGTSNDFSVFNVHAAQLNPAAPYWWTLPSQGGTGSTPATTFDFNGDGISEILYRGSDLRISYGGAAPFPPGVDSLRRWFRMGAQTGTSDEYPVVADVDNDGEAEIVFTVDINNGVVADMGALRVLESAEGPWVPCRNLWNQYNYFVVNVNDDLSIPAEQQLHHLELPAGSGRRPLNRYLSQRLTLGGKIPLPDVTAQVKQVSCLNGDAYIQLQVCNTGSKKLKAGTPIAFYKTNPTTGNAMLIAQPAITIPALAVDSCAVIDIVLPPFSGSIFGVVNDDGSVPRPFDLAVNFPSTTEFECNYLNNLFQVDFSIQAPAFDLGPDYSACKDTVLTLKAGPGHTGYLWQDGSTDSTFQAQGPGLYWVRVQDQCVGTRTDSIRVEAFGYPQIQLDTVNGDCTGTPASATVSVLSAYPPFTYLWSTTDSGASISGVQDGIYTVTVTDANGCSIVGSSPVNAGGQLEVASTVKAIPCDGQTGAIDLVINTGKAPFTYAWSNNSNSGSLQNIPAGIYTVSVTDADDCLEVLQFNLTEPAPLLSTGFTAGGACPGESNGSALFLGGSQGTAPYQIEWPDGSAAPQLNSVPAGVYILTLTDANGCTITDAVEVPELTPPTLDTLVRSISCFGAADGGVTLNASGGSPGFGYQWSNMQSTPSVQDLGPGAYSLTLTYADGHCSEAFDFLILEPLPLLSLGVSATPSCPDTVNGSVSFLGATQGTAPYSLKWPDGSTLPDLGGLAPGIYTVVVTDANGCSTSDSATVTAFGAPTVQSAISPASCAGSTDGAISLDLSGGTPVFAFQWSSGQNTEDIQQLGPGAYSLTLTFANGNCAQSFSYQVAGPQAIGSNGFTTLTACPGTSGGSATFLGASQGNPPYTLLWSNSATTTTISDVPAGDYQLTITDMKGCTRVENVQVPVFEAPQLDSNVKPVSCAGNSDGGIAVAVLAGTPGFGYIWSNNATTPDILNLAAGAYTLTITYADGACMTAVDFMVPEPLPLVSAGIITVPACAGVSNGAAHFSGASQGTPPYALKWSTGSTAMDLNGVPAGLYTLTITDANTCTLVEAVDITEFEAPVIDTMAQSIRCFGIPDGSLIATSSGSVPVSGYNWSTGKTGPVLNQLGPGTYTLTVTYGNGQCSTDYTFQLTEPPVLEAEEATVGPINCNGAATGSVTSLPAGGTAPYTYAWSGGQLTALIDSLTAGNYTLTVTDANGCTTVANFELTQPPAFVLTPEVKPDTCQSTSGSISVTAGGGVKPYSFAWSNNAGTQNISGLIAGNYTLTLTDAKGCSQVLQAEVPAWDVLPDFTSYSDTITCAEPAATIGIQSQTTNLKFAWTGPGGILPDQPVQTVSTPGNYMVLVTNTYGCTATADIEVAVDNQVPIAEAGPGQIQAPCQAAVLSLDATGSSSGADYEPHWYQWSNGIAVFDTIALAISVHKAGLYVFVNTDRSNGCVATDSVRVDWSEPVQAGVLIDSITCFGENDGAIRVRLLGGGTAPFLYSIDNQIFTDNSDFENLSPGTYPITVSDAAGCQWEASVTLTEPQSFSVNLIVSDTLLELGQYLLLQAILLPTGFIPASISWEPAVPGILPGELRQKLQPQEKTEYVVLVADDRGCTASDRVTVSVVSYQTYVPNSISVGSAENDRFTVYSGSGIVQIQLLQVFDRWGNQVFEQRGFAPNDATSGWDGHFRGKPVDPGVFIWRAELEGDDGRVVRISGDVTVFR